MPILIHVLAQLISMDECFRIEDDVAILDKSWENVQHLSILMSSTECELEAYTLH